MKHIRTAGILVLCLCIVFLTACSGSKSDMTISANKITAAAGETVEIAVTLSEGSNLSAADIEVVFDSAKLSYVGYDDGESFSPEIHLGNLAEEGRFHYALATLTPLTDAGTIFTLELKVAEEVSGELPFTIEVPTLVNADGEALSADVVNGTITVQ